MKLKSILFFALATTAACGAAGILLLALRTAPGAPRQPAKAASTANPAAARSWPKQSTESAAPVAPLDVAPHGAPPDGSAETTAVPQARSQPAAGQVRSIPGQADPPPQDELARVALSFVGVDPEAEAYWIETINDPTVSADERQNLIEDLNEDGLPDPKHPSPTDLALILNRIALIEELADGAMDKVNADAFAEAHKDLVNLAKLATGGGEPVK